MSRISVEPTAEVSKLSQQVADFVCAFTVRSSSSVVSDSRLNIPRDVEGSELREEVLVIVTLPPLALSCYHHCKGRA